MKTRWITTILALAAALTLLAGYTALAAQGDNPPAPTYQGMQQMMQGMMGGAGGTGPGGHMNGLTEKEHEKMEAQCDKIMGSGHKELREKMHGKGASAPTEPGTGTGTTGTSL